MTLTCCIYSVPLFFVYPGCLSSLDLPPVLLLWPMTRLHRSSYDAHAHLPAMVITPFPCSQLAMLPLLFSLPTTATVWSSTLCGNHCTQGLGFSRPRSPLSWWSQNFLPCEILHVSTIFPTSNPIHRAPPRLQFAVLALFSRDTYRCFGLLTTVTAPHCRMSQRSTGTSASLCCNDGEHVRSATAGGQRYRPFLKAHDCLRNAPRRMGVEGWLKNPWLIGVERLPISQASSAHGIIARITIVG
jgi:hypothetical protein